MSSFENKDEDKDNDDDENEDNKDQNEDGERVNKPSFVYLLVSTKNATYVGATMNLARRLRQHNKELVGGAFATSVKVVAGETWNRACHVAGFPDWRAALQFEWRWKQLSRKISAKMFPLERRMKALKELLALERPTSKAITYLEWSTPPEVILETPEATRFFG